MPTTSGSASIDTMGSNYDTVLGVWTGTRGALQGVPNGCNDDASSGGAQSAVTIAVSAGTTYFIEVASYSSSGAGILKLNVSIDPISADTTPPTGRITAPLNDAVVASCPLQIEAEASDTGSGVAWVRFWAAYDGGWHEISTDSTGADGWTASWDCSQVGNQPVILTTWMQDNADNLAMDPGGYVNITLNKSAAPAVTIESLQTANWSGQVLSYFNPGAEIGFRITATNHLGGAQTSTWSWTVQNLDGIVIPDLSYVWQTTMGAGSTSLTFQARIPQNLPGDIYKFIGQVQIGATEAKAITYFVVTSDATPTATHTPTPTATRTVTVTPTHTPTTTPNTGSVEGYAFADLNGNGARDAQEPGLSGAVFVLAQKVELYTATSGPDGKYRFDAVPPDQYQLMQKSPPPGYLPSPVGSLMIRVNAAQTLTWDFGYEAIKNNTPTPTPTATRQNLRNRSYLPLLLREQGRGIYGRVTHQGQPIAGITFARQYDTGAEWSIPCKTSDCLNDTQAP